MLDTHAGEGTYSLTDQDVIAKRDELAFKKTLALKGQSSLLDDYINIVESYVNQGLYPGSPAVLLAKKRPQDTVHLNELAQKMVQELRNFAQRDAHIHQRDGFEALAALMPPTPRRGLVLIDPPYENATEYGAVEKAIFSAIKKWPNGIFLIWYPLLADKRIDKNSDVVSVAKAGLSQAMVDELTSFHNQPTFSIELLNTPAECNAGMYGSGVLIINPPYQLADNLEQMLAILDKNVVENGQGLSKLVWHRTAA